MENINTAFDNAMEKICKRCAAHTNCVLTNTKCAEYETLLAIKEELAVSDNFIEECDKLVSEIKRREEVCEREGICSQCGKAL